MDANLPKLDIDRIKRYNSELKKSVAKSAQLRAELDFNTQELDRLCIELSNDLGIEVTGENIELVYAELVRKIENNLQMGEEILNRINQQENSEDTQNIVGEIQI